MHLETFHCVQRLKLNTKEAKKRGWLSKERVRKYGDAVVHPEFVATKRVKSGLTLSLPKGHIA